MSASMPAIGANATSGDGLLANAPATGKAHTASFSDVLAQATDDAQAAGASTLGRELLLGKGNATKVDKGRTSTTSAPASSSRISSGAMDSREHHSAPVNARDSKEATQLLKQNAERDNLHVETVVPPAAAPLVKSAPVTASVPVATEATESDAVASYPMTSASVPPDSTAAAVGAGSAKTQITGTSMRVSSTGVSSTGESSTGVSTTTGLPAEAVASPVAFPFVSPWSSTLGSFNFASTTSVLFANSLDAGSNTVSNAAVPLGAAPAGPLEDSIVAPASSGAKLSASDPTQALAQAVAKLATEVFTLHGTEQATRLDDVQKPKTEVQTISDGTAKLVSDASPAHATNRLASAAVEVWQQPTQGMQSVNEGSSRPVTGRVTEAVNDSYTHVTERATPVAAETHQQTKQAVNVAVDANQAVGVSNPGNETMRTEARASVSTVSGVSDSGRGSQLSGNDKSEHGGKRESASTTQSGSATVSQGVNSTAPQGNNSDSKGGPAADTRTSLADLMVSQTLATASTKEASTSASFIKDSAESPDTSNLPGSKAADVDRPEQLATQASPISPVQSAKLVERVGQSELHVGFQAGELGGVDIRTSMVRNQVTAEISVEHGELRNLLAVELPHLEKKLAEHQATTTNLVLNDQVGGGSAGSRHAYQQSVYAPPGSASRVSKSEATTGMASI